jgi:hypothetical protein
VVHPSGVEPGFTFRSLDIQDFTGMCRVVAVYVFNLKFRLAMARDGCQSLVDFGSKLNYNIDASCVSHQSTPPG